MSIRRKIILVVVISIILTGMIASYGAKQRVERAMLAEKQDDALNLLRLIQHDIETMYDKLLRHELDYVAAQRRRLRTVSLGVIDVLDVFAQDTEGGKEKARLWLEQKVRSTPSIMVFDKELTGLAHDDTQRQGQSWRGFLNLKGGDAFEDARDKLRRRSGGYFSVFYWSKEVDPQAKHLGYFRRFHPWGWIVGVAAPLSDFEKGIAERRDEMLEELRHEFEDVRIGDTGYLALINGNNDFLIHPHLAGRNASHVDSAINVTALLERLKASVDSPEVMVEYSWTPGEGIEPHAKMAYVRWFKPLDWYIIYTLPKEELDAFGDSLAWGVIRIILTCSVIILLLLIMIITNFIRPLTYLTNVVQGAPGHGFEMSQTTLEKLQELANRPKDEAGRLATAFLALLNKLQEHLKRLKDASAQTERYAKQLEESNERLRHLDEIKTQFLSTVSHELRTPLTSIYGFAKMTRKHLRRNIKRQDGAGRLDKDKVEVMESNLGVIINEGERLTRLINDVLDFNKIESGHFEWNDVVFNVGDVVRTAAAAYAGSLAQKPHVKLVVDIPRQAPSILADKDKILQVLINLIDNAVKFTQNGEVIARVMLSEEKYVLVQVSDSGPGIPREQIPFVFEMFRQAHDANSGEKPKGSGLGLTICKHIIEHYKGDIWVESELGRGADFYVKLPLAS